MVFQTLYDRVGGSKGVRQNSTSPLEVMVQLGTAARAAAARDPKFIKAVGVVLRRFDMEELQVAVPTPETPSGYSMAAVRLPQQGHWAVSLSPDGEMLRVHVFRRHLPVSTMFGSAPYVLLVTLPTDRPGKWEVLCSTSFLVASKSVRPDKPACPRPEGATVRHRTPPLWPTGPAVGPEAIVNAWVAGTGKTPPSETLPPRRWVRRTRVRVSDGGTAISPGTAAAAAAAAPCTKRARARSRARAMAASGRKALPTKSRSSSPMPVAPFAGKPPCATLWSHTDVVDTLLGCAAPPVPLLQQDLEALLPSAAGGADATVPPAAAPPLQLCVGLRMSALLRASDLDLRDDAATPDPEDWHFGDFLLAGL
jgi:hypothetical protein